MAYNFFQSATITKNTAKTAEGTKVPRNNGIRAVYKNNGWWAKVHNKLYHIDNYKLSNGTVYSKPANDALPLWTKRQLTKLNIDNYLALDLIWSSLYDGQQIYGEIKLGRFILTKIIYEDI